MIELNGDRLKFRFPEVHKDARFSIDFQRTLRIPDDGRDYPLPPGLGRFPLRHLDDFAARLPEALRDRGGVIAPIHQAEALWVNFTARYPFAVKVATGKICAITGDPWTDRLNRDPQDYVVLPEQPWLDGYCVETGTVRQFVAMPLGSGFTVEEQLTGAAVAGGVQLVAYPMKAERYEAMREERDWGVDYSMGHVCYSLAAPDMGLAPGGQIEQEIYDDEYGLDAWDQRHGSRCFVTLLNSAQWLAVTDERPPTSPPTAQAYAESGLPWFSHYGGDETALSGSDRLRELSSVAQHAEAVGLELPHNQSVAVPEVHRQTRSRPVRECGAGALA